MKGGNRAWASGCWGWGAAAAVIAAASMTGSASAQTGACCTSGACAVTTQAACTTPSTWATGFTCSPNTCQTTGPDIIVCGFPDVSNNSPATVNGVSYDSFAVGTTSANRGSTPVNWWQSPDNRHPAIAQNIFRYVPTAGGRFEQLGQGSLKHGFTALQHTDCAFPNYFTVGCSATSGTTLGTGCADPYCCGLNNAAGGMGPKWEVNAATGLFHSPYDNAWQANSGPPRARMTDLQSAPTGTKYFMEGQYVVGDDAAAMTNGLSNKNNNASWQEVAMSPTAGTPAAATATDFSIALGTDPIHREQPAIYAWKTIDPGVQISTFDEPNDGRFILACRVTGTGPYVYEYALHNLNSNRCAGSFIVPLPGAHAALSAVEFHGVEAVSEPNHLPTPTDPHSGDWSMAGSENGTAAISWAGPAYAGTQAVYTTDTTPYHVASFTPGTGNDHTANVLRWGSMFNFRFTSDVAPVSTGSIAVGLWRPGPDSFFTFANVPTPGGATIGALTASCCSGGACTLLAAASCTGVPGMPGSTCTAGLCELGTCCDTGVCTMSLSTACTAAWTTGGACLPNPCPAPTGACCPSTSCTVTTQAGCPTGYQGNNTSCISGPCPPANNSCADAIWIADGVPITASSINSSTDFAGGSLPSTCGTGQTSGSDVWFKYKPVTSGNVRVTTNTVNNVGSTSFDTVISVHTACGSGAQVIGCNDDAGTPGNSSNIAAVTLTAGNTYLIRVAGYGLTPATGTFTLTVIGGGGIIPPTPPANDTCSAATAASLGAVAFTTVAASTDGPTHAACNFNASNQITNDVWFFHVGTVNGALRIDTCAGPGFDTKIAVYSGNACPVSDATLLACNDDGACGSGRSKVSIPVTRNANYLIRVGSAAGATGSGTLTLSVCRADFNGDGILSVADIFDYLNAWFAGTPRSDFNMSGGLSVQDIFDMINAWFVGGC